MKTASLEDIRRESEAIGVATIKKLIDGKMVEYRRAVCSCCGAVEEVRHAAITRVEQIKQGFAAKGWLFEKHAVVKCPACSKAREAKPEKKERIEVQQIKPQAASATRTMTPADRAKIREFLDGHYDERRECLLDGFTDKTAGEKLGVPWAWVRDMREFAYGPIKGDPELMEIRAELEKVQGVVAGLAAKLAAAEKRVSGL